MSRARTVTSWLLLLAVIALAALGLAGCGPDGGGSSKSDWCQLPNASCAT